MIVNHDRFPLTILNFLRLYLWTSVTDEHLLLPAAHKLKNQYNM